VKKHVARILSQQGWQAAGGGWQGVASELQLSGWSCARRVVVLRRLLRDTLAVTEPTPNTGQAIFAGMAELKSGCELYEYAVLVTSLSDEVLSIAQLYRDRAETENIFDELKNQWGWTGFTTHDLQRCQILARLIGLIYNWWSLYTRLAIPNRHTEANTSRPLLLHGVARQTQHANQATLTITSLHAHAPKVRQALDAVSQFLQRVRQTAEQLSSTDRWRVVLHFIFRDWLSNSATPPDLYLLMPG
jgi:hypothetical protein